jgi:hypothetical protein
MDDKQDGIFSALIGHAGAKAILRSALRRGDIHLMLTGPPASGKSVALLAIEEAIDGARYEDARGFTERKLRDKLAENPPALLLDEFDNMQTDAFKALNLSLEQGRVTKNVTGDAYDKEIDTQVFVACNYPDRLADDVRDRFVEVEFDPYSREEFIEVCSVLLPEQVEWVREAANSAQIGAMIGEVVWDKTDSHSPRTARDAARLADSPSRVEPIVKALNDSKADVDSEPVTVEELPHSEWETDSEDEQSRKPKSLEEIRQNMADEDEIEAATGEELLDALDIEDASGDELVDNLNSLGEGDGEGGGDDTDDSGGGDSDSDPKGETTETTEDQPDPEPEPEPEPDTGGGSGGDTLEAAYDYIERMIEADNRVIGNQFEMLGVSFIYPEDMEAEMIELKNQWRLTGGNQKKTNPQDPYTLQGMDGDFTESLRALQFVFDDPEQPESSLYDLDSIAAAVEDEPVLVTRSPGVQWEPFEGD